MWDHFNDNDIIAAQSGPLLHVHIKFSDTM